MIRAEKKPLFEAIFSRYNRWYLLKRAFRSLSVKGAMDAVPAGGGPVLYVMNHCSFWDGLVVYEAIRRLSARSHFMMMDEAQMRQFRFFRKIGAFSIDKTSPSAMRPSLRYAEGLLREGQSVWLFPQGDIAHLESRPLRFQTGAAFLLGLCPETVVVPVSVYYSFGLHPKPEASLVFGEPQRRDWSGFGRRQLAEELERAVTEQLDGHRADVLAAQRTGLPLEYRPLLAPGASLHERFDRFNTWRRKAVSRWNPFSG